jgi:hypothetical protein
MTDVNAILQLAVTYENECSQGLVKLAKIRKMPEMECLKIVAKNKKRVSKKQYMKHFDHSKVEDGSPIIDLTDIDEFAYSAIMRKLRQKGKPEQVKQFLAIYKQQFDKAVKGKLHKPEKIALQNTMVRFNKLYKVKLDTKMVKCATVAELGNAQLVGKYLSDIVKFTLQHLPSDKQQHALNNLKQKFTVMSEEEIASKQLPESSALGQAITFVKHVLFNHDAKYVREVLNSLVRSL